MFCEKLPFDSLFSSESLVFPMRFLCVLKMYHVRHFIVEKIGFGIAPKRCGIHSKPQSLLQKTFLFYASENLAAYARMCLRTHALARVRKSRATLVILFPKIDFCSFKRLYFPF